MITTKSFLNRPRNITILKQHQFNSDKQTSTQNNNRSTIAS